MTQPSYRAETIALHGGQTPDPTTGALQLVRARPQRSLSAPRLC
jgi:hypothetical protein